MSNLNYLIFVSDDGQLSFRVELCNEAEKILIRQKQGNVPEASFFTKAFRLNHQRLDAFSEVKHAAGLSSAFIEALWKAGVKYDDMDKVLGVLILAEAFRHDHGEQSTFHEVSLSYELEEDRLIIALSVVYQDGSNRLIKIPIEVPEETIEDYRQCSKLKLKLQKTILVKDGKAY